MMPNGELDTNTKEFETEFGRRAAVFVAGDTPAVITETLCLLLRGEDCPSHRDDGKPHRFRPTEIHIITTSGAGAGAEDGSDCRDAYRSTYLGKILDCLAHYEIRTISIDLHYMGREWPTSERTVLASTENKCLMNGTCLGTVAPALAEWTELKVREFEPLRANDDKFLFDVRTDDENRAAGEYITRVVEQLALPNGSAAQCKVAIHASLAGGRKSMSSFLQGAMSLYGRRQDRLTHVTVDDSLETWRSWSNKNILPRGEYQGAGRSGAFLLPSDRNQVQVGKSAAKAIWLSSIPFVFLSAVAALREMAGKPLLDVIAETQSALMHPALVIDFNGHCITLNGQVLALQPMQKAHVTWFATQRKEGIDDGWIETNLPSEPHEKIKKALPQLRAALSFALSQFPALVKGGKPSTLNEAIPEGTTSDKWTDLATAFETRRGQEFSDITKEFQRVSTVFGLGKLKAFEDNNIDLGKRAYRINLEPGQITLTGFTRGMASKLTIQDTSLAE